MAEKQFDIKGHLVKTLDAPIATLFKIEDSASPVLQEVAYSMRNEYLKLCDEGPTKSGQDFRDIGQFIESMKRSGVPAEIRANREHLINFLGAGFGTFIDVVEFGSPTLRQVEYSWRFAEMEGIPGQIPFLKHEPVPPCWSVLVDAPFKQMTEQVKNATSEQKKGGENVVKAIENISEIAKNNLSAVEQLSRSAKDMSQQSEGLQELVQEFKID